MKKRRKTRKTRKMMNDDVEGNVQILVQVKCISKSHTSKKKKQQTSNNRKRRTRST
jgi:hypothetical protein